MWKFFVAASCLLVACRAQYGTRAASMGGVVGTVSNGMYTFAPGFTVDLRTPSLETICNNAVMKSGVTDHLSDVMRTAVQYKLRMGSNLMTLGGNNPKWDCLIQASTSGFTNPTNAANGVGDYFDTATELRIQPFLPFKYNPCEMVFCGEPGMTPSAVAMQVLMKLQSGQRLAPRMASTFGRYASMLTGPSATHMGGMMSAGGMGMNPMMAMRAGGMMAGGMPNMMQNMMRQMNPGPMAAAMNTMGGAGTTTTAIKTPSTNAVSATGTDPGTNNTVTTNKSSSAQAPAAPTSSSSTSSTGTAVSNTLPSGGGMMSNPFKAMGMSPMGGGGGMGMGGMGMGMPGMGMPGMGMPGMGMGMSGMGMGMPGMGMGMPGMGMGMPGMGMGMPGMGMGMPGMGSMGNMLGAMMMGEYLMDMPDPPAYGMRGGYGHMGMGGPAMPGMPGSMPGMPGSMPGMQGSMPRMPGMPGSMPRMPGSMPGMPGMPPPPPPSMSSYHSTMRRPPPPPPRPMYSVRTAPSVPHIRW